MTAVWPWLTLAGLGAFHGLNPAMGWLFAVALGLHRHSLSVVLLSLLPIALGHALAITLVVFAAIVLNVAVDQEVVRMCAGLLLIGWAIYQALYGHRHRVRVGMQAGMAGLVLWSFLMATAHGAGLMLLPVLIPLCLTASSTIEITATGTVPISLAAVGVHTTAMLAVTGAVATAVYQWAGLGFLRRGWINLDLVWIIALIAAGALVILG